MQRAYRLFTGGGEGPIGIEELRRVARELREEVGEVELREMLEVAGGEGRGGVDL